MRLVTNDKLREETDSYYAGLSNQRLFDEAFQAAEPDEYDGCFTFNGLIAANSSRAELEKRLKVWLEQ